MGGQKRFVKKIPPSGAAPSFKLTLPHQVVHQYLLHLVDNDLELAGSPDAKQTWHASIAPRRNKERSEFTLQGWRLFAEAHKVQAGDQVAFELVTKNRLVAQIIKHADGVQPPKAPKAAGVKRKASGPRAPRSVFQRTSGGGDYMKALDDVPLPLEDEWGSFSEQLSSATGTCYSVDAKSCMVPQTYKTEPQVVPEWGSEDRGMELGYHKTRHSLDSTCGGIPRSRLSTPPMVVPELSYSSCMGTPNTPPSPLAFAPHPDLLDDNYHDIIMGDDEPFVPNGMYGGGTPSRQPSVAPSMGRHTSTPPPADIQNPVKGQMEELAALVQSLQRQAHAAQSEAEAARHRCERMRASLQGLQSSLRGHSRKALKAAMGLETCSANLSYTHNVPADMTSWLGQLKDSLSQLLVMAIDDDHMGVDPTPASLSSASQSTFDQFAMPL